MKGITFAIIITIIFSAGAFLSTPQISFAEGLVPCGGYEYDDTGALMGEEPPCNFGYIIVLAQNVIEFLIFKLAAPLAALVIAWAGFLYVTSAANPGQREKAKKILTNVVLGFVIALAAWLIVKTLLSSLGVESDYLADPPEARLIEHIV